MLVAWIALVMQLNSPVPGEPLSVANVINESEKYAGRSVTITGILSASEEFRVVTGVGCRKRMNAMKREFACAATLVLPDCRRPSEDCSEGLLDVQNELRRIMFSSADRPKVVLKGRLEVAPRVFLSYYPAEIIPGIPNGEYVQMGFGHMNAFPVRLIVTDGRLVPSVGK